MQKTALIFGVTGQDGSYLADLLLQKGYYVVGVSRRSSTPNDQRICHLASNDQFCRVDGDVTDPLCVFRLITQHLPHEIYNLAAQSHVKVSFDEPIHTWAVTAGGCLNILEAVRTARSRAVGGNHYVGYMKPYPRIYQASSSEMFGSCWSYRSTENGVQHRSGAAELGGIVDCYDAEGNKCGTTNLNDCAFQNESTPMQPNSPYAIAKLAAHNAVRVYRESYGIFACSGILFNHESERRGEAFVTRKITKHLSRVAYGRRHGKPPDRLCLGNLEARRDWGHAKDYVRAMWLMLQSEAPDDYVVSTGETRSVRQFLLTAFQHLGIAVGNAFDDYIEIDPALYRPSEVPFLKGDSSKIRKALGWKPEVSFNDLVKQMVLYDVSDMWGTNLGSLDDETTEEVKVSDK